MACGNFPLRQDLLPHMPADIRQADVAAAPTVGELFVIDAELVEDGGPDVVDGSDDNEKSGPGHGVGHVLHDVHR